MTIISNFKRDPKIPAELLLMTKSRSGRLRFLQRVRTRLSRFQIELGQSTFFKCTQPINSQLATVILLQSSFLLQADVFFFHCGNNSKFHSFTSLLSFDLFRHQYDIFVSVTDFTVFKGGLLLQNQTLHRDGCAGDRLPLTQYDQALSILLPTPAFLPSSPL